MVSGDPAPGLLLVNVGTPDEPTTPAVRRYLREFLSDPYVLDMPDLTRHLLLELVILPFRPRRSAEAYRRIWMDQGSPLLVHSQDLTAQVQAELGAGFCVELGMRYGRPSIRDALTRLRERGVRQARLLPLLPQYARATWQSAVDRAQSEARRILDTELHVISPFHDQPAYLDALAASGRELLAEVEPERVVISFHGLPEKQIRAADPKGRQCLVQPECCLDPGAAISYCYRAQCHSTARGLRERLGLQDDMCEVTFQSRMGRTPWIGPHTDQRLRELAQAGVRRLVVFCPSFVTDCLETLDEIGYRARKTFQEHGGSVLRLVPSLNADAAWVQAIAQLAR